MLEGKELRLRKRAEWLAFRFCSFYFAACRLWKTRDFRNELGLLITLPKELDFYVSKSDPAVV
jgi:hypothetical protein